MLDQLAASFGRSYGGGGGTWTLTSLIEFITQLISITIPIAVAACLFFFFWGIVQVFFESEDTKKLAEGRSKIIWGLLALFVIASIAGIVSIVQATILGTS